MSESVLNLASAIQLAKAAEKKASELYGAAAREAVNPLVKRLFEQLTEFEGYHYRKLVELERSLKEEGAFIEYKEFDQTPMPTTGEVTRIEGVKKTSAAKVFKQAMESEAKAAERYTGLADQTSDPQGRQMFLKLAKEERGHYSVLQASYYDVSNLKPLA
mgnify:CR=1 FL=1